MSTYQTALTQFGTDYLPQVLPEFRQAAARMLPFTRGSAKQPAVQPEHASETFEASTEDTSLTASELWRALKDERIVPHYHPQFDLASGRTVAVEALARVIDEEGRPIRPDSFISEAESSGVIVPLGRTMIRQACRALACWRSSGRNLQRIGFNLSSRQLALDTTLAPFVRRTAAEFGLSPADLELELTESQFLETGCLGLDTLRELKELGTRIAIDDFGVNYAFISELESLDVDTVKLHPSIIGRLAHDSKAADLVRFLVALSQDMGMHVVAVGIETDPQIEYLRKIGCQYGQGYVHTRPIPKAEIYRFLQS
jgi:EAL domain-containing protein (putative c-di-GMP-specific phosphodiesterase class I)